MKLRFFGDSWFWCWFDPGTLRSNILNADKLPIIEWYLKALNVECISYNYPGNSLIDTTNTIVSSSPEGATYNVVFVSFPIRRHDIQNYSVQDYKTFTNEYEEIILDCLSKMQLYAETHDQYFLLIGGQATLHKELFSRLESSSRLYLISECVLSDLLVVNPPFGIFKLADFTKYVDTNFDKDLVNDVYTHLTQLDNHPDKQFIWWPDNSGHLNPSAVLIILDRILHKIEELENS